MRNGARHFSHALNTVFAAGFTLPVLYFASYGPYVMLANSGWLGPVDSPVLRMLWTLYRPMVLLTDHFPALRETLAWYVSLWIG